MLGLMQDFPLLVHRVLDHAARWHGETEIVSRSVEGPIHRTTYGELDRRARALASAVQAKLGVDAGHHRRHHGLEHLAAHGNLVWRDGGGRHRPYAEPAAVRRSARSYIINHAEDQWIFTDLSFVPLFEKLQDQLPGVKGFVIMTDAAHMPASTTLRNPICYEELVALGDRSFEWPEFDENTACGICYTSGTTGNPKGVVYSHRSNVLHSLSVSLADSKDISSRDCVMPVVPMFHANAWSLTFTCPMSGAKMVMPGPKLDGASLYELLDTERVTFTAAVPTILLSLLQHLEQHPDLRLPHLQRVFIGGSACPEIIFKVFGERYGVNVIHGWGMTEMSPIGTIGTRSARTAELSDEQWWPIKLKQGRVPFMVDMKITDDDGNSLPHDGKTFGRLKVRGPAVARSYFKGEGASAFDAARLVRHRRCGDDRRVRLHADNRPRQGCDQVGRRMDFIDRAGKHRGRL